MGADQLCSYCEADLHLCFRIGKNLVFSYAAHVYNVFRPTTGGQGLLPTPKTAQLPTGNGHTIAEVLEKKTDEITENVMS